MSAAAIAKALDGRSSGNGGFLCRCPVPTHGRGEGDRHPSLSIRDGDDALLVRCFAGCDPRDILDELRRRGLLEVEGGGHADRHDDRRTRRVTDNAPETREPEPDPEAVALWQSAVAITGTLGGEYLHRHRGISVDPPPSLRFLPDVIYPRTGHGFPALIAAVQRPDRKIVAAQITYLRPSDGAKAPVSAPRLTVGRLGTGAIRLGAADEVLGLAEGTETALSAMELSGVPCWSSLGGQRLAKVTVPSTVREIHIFADDDEAGRLAAEMAAGRYTRDGLKVVLRWPPKGCADWNDALRARRSIAA